MGVSIGVGQGHLVCFSACFGINLRKEVHHHQQVPMQIGEQEVVGCI